MSLTDDVALPKLDGRSEGRVNVTAILVLNGRRECATLKAEARALAGISRLGAFVIGGA
jgi:hypothetical protein